MAFRPLARVFAGVAVPLACLAIAQDAAAQNSRALDARAAQVIEHWTPERRAAALPRDFVIDPRGFAYLRGPGNSLTPYGHGVAAEAGNAGPFAGPGGDTTGPTVADMNPAAGSIVTTSNYTFSATVTDPSGVKSVSVKIQKGAGRAQSFNATRAAGSDVWGVSLQGLSDGTWTWWMVAKDGAGGGGNTTTSEAATFSVALGSGGGGGGGGGGDPEAVPNSEWTGGGIVQEAAGRIYFEMPTNRKRTRWAGYVCSGTVVTDDTSGRSMILTAAHCVYDDANKAFARNVLFIPNQADTQGTGTDRNCSNDPNGCWAPSLGVVDTHWTTRVFPDNIPWDYAFYVVPDSGAHTSGYTGPGTPALDVAVEPMTMSFSTPSLGTLAHALGYSYSQDPQFMYCADKLTIEGTANWWLPNCGLSGGSSGGPWSQPFNVTTGNGPVISVNSWGYTNQPGMAGPKLSDTSAACVFALAKSAVLGSFSDGEAGVKASCP
jgi:hypothetical protein